MSSHQFFAGDKNAKCSKCYINSVMPFTANHYCTFDANCVLMPAPILSKAL